MSDAGTLELVELDMNLDFEHAPTCDGSYDGRGCGSLATGLATLMCCGQTAYGCDYHYKVTVKEAAKGTCRRCHTKSPTVAWTPIA